MARSMYGNDICSIVWAGMLFLCTVSCSSAHKFPTKKEFTRRNVPAKSVMTLRTIVPSADDIAAIKKESGVAVVDDTIMLILARGSGDTLSAAVAFVKRMLSPHNQPHHVGVALGPDGSVREIALIGEHGDYPARLAAESFLEQFSRVNKDVLQHGTDINGVTGATFSSKLVVDVVNMIRAAFRLFGHNAAGGATEE